MPWGQENFTKLDRLQSAMSQFSEREASGAEALAQLRERKNDRQNAMGTLRWVAGQDVSDIKNLPGVVSKAGAQLSQTGGAKSEQAAKRIHDWAQNRIDIEPRPRTDTSVTPYEDWRTQNPQGRVEDYLTLQTNQAVTRNRESKPEIVGWENRSVNGVNMLMPITGFVGEDGSVRRVDPKAFHPQLSESGGGGIGVPRAKDVEKYRAEALDNNTAMKQAEDDYGLPWLMNTKEKLSSDPDYLKLLRTPAGQMELAFQGMNKEKAERIRKLLKWEGAKAKTQSARLKLNGMGYGVNLQTGELIGQQPGEMEGTSAALLPSSTPPLLRRPEGTTQAQPRLSSEDQEAIAWARANRNDPRAQKILKLHGVK